MAGAVVDPGRVAEAIPEVRRQLWAGGGHCRREQIFDGVVGTLEGERVKEKLSLTATTSTASSTTISYFRHFCVPVPVGLVAEPLLLVDRFNVVHPL